MEHKYPDIQFMLDAFVECLAVPNRRGRPRARRRSHRVIQNKKMSNGKSGNSVLAKNHQAKDFVFSCSVLVSGRKVDVEAFRNIRRQEDG